MLTSLEKQILKSARKHNHADSFAWIKVDEIIKDVHNVPYGVACCACCSLRANGYLDECIRCLDGEMIIHLSETGAHYHKKHWVEPQNLLMPHNRKSGH